MTDFWHSSTSCLSGAFKGRPREATIGEDEARVKARSGQDRVKTGPGAKTGSPDFEEMNENRMSGRGLPGGNVILEAPGGSVILESRENDTVRRPVGSNMVLMSKAD